MVFPCALGMDKKPTYGRCFWSLIVACLLACPSPPAGEVSAYDGFLLARHFRLAFLLSLLNQFSRRERSPSFSLILQSVCSCRFRCWFELNL